MRYRYRGLIKQNIAPKGATKIVIKDANGNQITTIPLVFLERPIGSKLYSFGLLSDIHCAGNNSEEKKRFDNALTYFEQQDCVFCCHSGDMTNVGFHNDSDGSYNPWQMEEYKNVIDSHPNLPVYGCCGNHESYGTDITCCVGQLPSYTGIPSLHYSMEYQNDIFIFLSQPAGNKPMSDEALTWLGTTLEINKNKRCFVFVHPFIDDGDSGNPYGLYGNKVFDWWGEKKYQFINIIRQYNTIVFHGHSHISPNMQEEIKHSNYSEQLGFRSVHVPSISYERKVEAKTTLSVDYNVGYGYLVDVYTDFIILNGFNVVNNKVVGIATYKIDFRYE